MTLRWRGSPQRRRVRREAFRGNYEILEMHEKGIFRFRINSNKTLRALCASAVKKGIEEPRNSIMKAMVLKEICSLHENSTPLVPADLPVPVPGEREVLLRVTACGVCHTDLDEIEGRTPPPRLPVVLGHQVVGRVESGGPGASRFEKGDRVGVAWIHSA